MKRTDRLISALAVLTALLGATSCSIKEDRWPCPCYLILRAGSGVDLERDGGFTLSVFTQQASKEMSQDFSWSNLKDDSYDAKVSKGYKEMSITSGISRQYISATDLLIIEGNQCDSIQASFARVDCTGETAIVPVEPHKQFSTVFMRLIDDGKGGYPYYIRARGSVNGLNLLTMEPTRGAFSCRPDRCELDCADLPDEVVEDMRGIGFDKLWDSALYRYSFRLPRQDAQGEKDLMLDFYEKSAVFHGSDTYVDSIPLGELIARSGHDWSRDDLQDIYITVDFAKAAVTITVNDWTVEWTGDFEI